MNAFLKFATPVNRCCILLTQCRACQQVCHPVDTTPFRLTDCTPCWQDHNACQNVLLILTWVRIPVNRHRTVFNMIFFMSTDNGPVDVNRGHVEPWHVSNWDCHVNAACLSTGILQLLQVTCDVNWYGLCWLALGLVYSHSSHSSEVHISAAYVL